VPLDLDFGIGFDHSPWPHKNIHPEPRLSIGSAKIAWDRLGSAVGGGLYSHGYIVYYGIYIVWYSGTPTLERPSGAGSQAAEHTFIFMSKINAVENRPDLNNTPFYFVSLRVPESPSSEFGV